MLMMCPQLVPVALQTDFEKAISERLAQDASKAGTSKPGELDSVPGASSTLK